MPDVKETFNFFEPDAVIAALMVILPAAVRVRVASLVLFVNVMIFERVILPASEPELPVLTIHEVPLPRAVFKVATLSVAGVFVGENVSGLPPDSFILAVAVAILTL